MDNNFEITSIKNIYIVADSCYDDPWDINVNECCGESELYLFYLDALWIEDKKADELLSLSDTDLINEIKNLWDHTDCADWYITIYSLNSNHNKKRESDEDIAKAIREWLIEGFKHE